MNFKTLDKLAKSRNKHLEVTMLLFRDIFWLSFTKLILLTQTSSMGHNERDGTHYSYESKLLTIITLYEIYFSHEHPQLFRELTSNSNNVINEYTDD